MFPLRPSFAIIAQFEIFGVDIDKTALIFGHVFFGEDGLNRAFRLAGATVNALIGVDVEHGFAFAVDGMDAIDGANLLALGFVKMPNAFGAAIWVNFVNTVALINCLVWAFGLTDVTVNTFVSDNQCHSVLIYGQGSGCLMPC